MLYLYMFKVQVVIWLVFYFIQILRAFKEFMMLQQESVEVFLLLQQQSVKSIYAVATAIC